MISWLYLINAFSTKKRMPEHPFFVAFPVIWFAIGFSVVFKIQQIVSTLFLCHYACSSVIRISQDRRTNLSGQEE